MINDGYERKGQEEFIYNLLGQNGIFYPTIL